MQVRLTCRTLSVRHIPVERSTRFEPAGRGPGEEDGLGLEEMVRGVAGAGRKKGEGLWELVKTLEEEEEGLEVFFARPQDHQRGCLPQDQPKQFHHPWKGSARENPCPPASTQMWTPLTFPSTLKSAAVHPIDISPRRSVYPQGWREGVRSAAAALGTAGIGRGEPSLMTPNDPSKATASLGPWSSDHWPASPLRPPPSAPLAS